MTEPKQSFTEERGADKYARFTIGVETHPEYIELDLISHTKPLHDGEVYELVEHSALVAERARRIEVEKELELYRGYLKKAIDRGAKQVDEITTLRAKLRKADEIMRHNMGGTLDYFIGLPNGSPDLELQKKGQGDE